MTDLLDPHLAKIDRTFILNMDHSESAAVVVSSTIELGHNLGLRVVAEGSSRPTSGTA